MVPQYDLSHFVKITDLLVQHVGEETLLYNERTHQAFCLNAVAGQVWQLLESLQTAPELASAATLALRLPVTEEIVLFTLAELRRDGLIQVQSGTAPAALPSRREMMQKLGAGAVMMLPVVAAITAPKAAQAYNGCVDCTANPGDGDDADGSSKLNKSQISQQEQQSAQRHSTTQSKPSDYHPLFVP